MSTRLKPLILLSVVALSACSSVVNVKEVTADPEIYQSTHFNTAALPEGVRKALPTSTAASNFSKVVFKKEVVFTGLDDKDDKADVTSTYTNLGNGVVSIKSDMSRNGIAFMLSYSNNYRGVLALRSQSVPLRGQATSAITEIKSISQISPLPFAAGKEFVAKYESGPTMQIVNFEGSEKKCTSGAQFAASQVVASIPGKAFELRCEFIFHNTVQSRSKYVYFEQFGFAVETEHVSAGSKTMTRITDFKG